MITEADRLAALREVLGDEAVEDALRFLPDAEREAEAVRIERERRAAERTATHLTMRETRDEILGGRYGKEAAVRLQREIDDRGGAENPNVLRAAARIAAEERKSEYYRKLNTKGDYAK